MRVLFVFCVALTAESIVRAAGHQPEFNIQSDQLETKEISTSQNSKPIKDDGHHPFRCSSDWLFSRPSESTGIHKSSNPFEQSNSDNQSNETTTNVDNKLHAVLSRFGPDMKPANGFRDYNDISIEVARRAWQLMHHRTAQVSNDKIDSLWPHVEKSLLMSNVSERCQVATRKVADGAKALKSWAIRLLNSWGAFPPAGLFEGTLGDIGSYHGCVNIEENPIISHTHYCTIAFRPVLPTRENYDLIINQEPRQLTQMFDQGDAFGLLASKAHYHHYVYLKLGSCFPIDCGPRDVQKFAHLLASEWFLMSGPVKCHSKFSDDYQDVDPTSGQTLKLSAVDINDGVYIWKPHLTREHLISLVILSILLGLSLTITMVDILCNRLPGMLKSFSISHLNQDSKIPHHYNQNGCLMTDDAETIRGLNDSSLDSYANNNPASLQMKRINYQKITINNDLLISSNIQIKTNMGHKNSVSNSDESLIQRLITDCSIVTNAQEFFSISREQLENDILCVNGLRCLTMSWIIIAHTIQYNDWSAFARIYEVEKHFKSLVNQPLFNASYLVDTFFLISGLLTSYSVFRPKASSRSVIHESNDENRNELDRRLIEFKEIWTKFSCRTHLIGRYLRLTPQILLVSLLFILLPLFSKDGGPHWYTMTGEYSENCAKNWWVNLLHIQAFYKQEEMCNFVCWWISVDMFYHLFALAIIVTILKCGPMIVAKLFFALASINLLFQASRHYQLGLPPNLLSTIPQTGAMWSDMTLKYFWTPFAHGFPFLFGLYVGYYLAYARSSGDKCKNWFTAWRAIYGWLTCFCSLALVLYGTFFWVNGIAQYSRLISTCFNLITQAIWSFALSWVILACEFGFGSFVAEILSCKVFLILGKASYLVYLSHFLILFTFFGSQNLLLEPTQLMITYIVLGNIFISMMFGSVLCILFEMPWLKLQKRIMRKIR